VATLGDYIKQLREIDNKRNECDQPNIANQSNQSDNESTSATSAPSSSAISGSNAFTSSDCSTDNQFKPNELGNIKCPDSGRICTTTDCPDECRGDTATEGQDASPWTWPCVIPGANSQTRIDSAIIVSADRFRSANTQGDTHE
jgi:hypothetical protein